MGAVKTLPVVDSFSETRELLTKVERDPFFMEISGWRIKVLLEEVRQKLSNEGVSTNKLQDLEKRWKEMTDKKPFPHQIKKIAQEIQELMRKLLEEVASHQEKKQRSDQVKKRKKDHIHKVRNTLQKLFISDNQELIIKWEVFEVLQYLLRDEMFEINPFINIFTQYKQALLEWKRLYQIHIFIINEDENQGLAALKSRIPNDELSHLGNCLEKMLDETTTAVQEWERENGLLKT